MQVIDHLKNMAEERFLTIYQALERDGYGPLDGEVARLMKFRQHAIKKLPMAQRAKRARTLLERTSNAELAYELFGSYLMKTQRELVTDFLDATGVPHEDGMINSVDEAQPAGDKIAGAIAQLDEKYEPSDVTLYLSMCAEQWPQVTEVDTLWRMR